MMREYNRFHTNREFAEQACSIHGKRFWTEDTGCRECARVMCEEEGMKLGSLGDPHNGAGCYDADSDFAYE